jgi:molecular chaperone GrpE (heat shock protein)
MHLFRMDRARNDWRTMPKRTYTRRSDDERIAELEAKLAKVKERLAEKKLRESPIHRETKKVERVLRKYAQTAVDHGREDLANSTLAFLAGLGRLADSAPHDGPGSRASRAHHNGA